MVKNIIQDYIASPIYRAALYSFEKISICSNTVFSLIREEGNAWKVFFLNNFYISKLYSIGSEGTASIARKIFGSSNQLDSHIIDSSNAPLEELASSNRAWIRDHSLFHKNYPDFKVSNKALLDVIFSKDTDNKGVIHFLKNFCLHTGNIHLNQSFSDWKKAYEQQQIIQKFKNQPQKIEQISRKLSQKVQDFTKRENHIVLLLEKEPDHLNSSLANHIKNCLKKIRSDHDILYQTLYSNIKEKLQSYLNTNLKKRFFTEIQEEVRVILLNQYSNIFQQSTLGHNLPMVMQQLLSGSVGQDPSPNENESLASVIWDLFLQNGIYEDADQPISIEKLNQIFEKEFEMITCGLEATALTGINRLLENVKGDMQPLLQLWHSKLPQKERGWLEITHQSDAYCQISLYARDMANPVGNITRYGESSLMKIYSYNNIPKNLLKTEFFFELLYGCEGGESLTSPIEEIKKFFSQFGKPIESHIQSIYSKIPKPGLLDHIKTYYSQADGSSVESSEKTFFQIRLHAFINYCKSVQNDKNVTGATLSTVEDGISALLKDTNKLYDAEQISDKEYIAIISTGLEIEECVIQKHQNLMPEVQPSEIIIPTVIKEQLQKVFSSINISQLDIENIKNFAKVLLGSDMNEEVALLCKELPINNHKQSSYTLPHVSFLKVMQDLCIDIKNLRTSPIALFRVYSDVQELLNNTRSIIILLNYIIVLLCCTNPATTLAYIAVTIIAIGILYNIPQLEPILDTYASILDFHREIYTFVLTRVLVRLLQLADIALHWKERASIQIARSFLTENLSRTVSFSLQIPIDPLQENIPQEVKPLQRFHPQMEVSANLHNAREISHILFPELAIEFSIEERGGVKRAHLNRDPGFWIADTITDRELESMDFAHLILENEEGAKKICIVSRPQERLLLQTLLKMAGSYSRVSIELLVDYLQNQIPRTEPTLYYYDWIDGEMSSQDFNAIGYLIVHYITSGDHIRSQKLIDQLKKMKASGLEHSEVILKTLEQIAYIVPNSSHSNINKMILELSALCNEIPLQSQAFPLFVRAYQAYISAKEHTHISYLSETEESLLLHHLQDHHAEDSISNLLGKLSLAFSLPLLQTLLLLGNNILDGFSSCTLFGKEGYIPASLKKYQLQREYLDGNKDKATLLINLITSNSINPYFSFSKDIINLKKTLDENKENIFGMLPTIISTLNMKGDVTKSDYAAVLVMIIGFAKHTLLLSRDVIADKEGIPEFALSIMRDTLAAFLTNPSSGHCIEEKLFGIVQEVLPKFLAFPTFGIETSPLGSWTRHITRTSIDTTQDYLNIDDKYKKRELAHSLYFFPKLHIGDEYVSLQTLEKNILRSYQKIGDTFLQKQNRSLSIGSELEFHRGDSVEDQMAQIVDWYASDHAQASGSFCYTLNSSQNRQDLTKRFNQIYETLQNMFTQQAKTIQHLLTHHPQNLPLLANRVEQYTQDIRNNSTAEVLSREQTRNTYSNQSTLEKVGTFALRYINTLLEVPTFGRVQIIKDSQIQSLSQEQSNLLQEMELIRLKREKLFQNMTTALKPQTSLGFNEVYAYFCQGKDISIIESLGLDDNQWETIKEQLYRYMLLQKYLSHAEYITGLCADTNRTIEENIDRIGHELDSMSSTLGEGLALEISVRSQLQFEKKLGRSLSPNLRNRLDNIVNGSVENFQSVYQFSRSQ